MLFETSSPLKSVSLFINNIQIVNCQRIFFSAKISKQGLLSKHFIIKIINNLQKKKNR